MFTSHSRNSLFLTAITLLLAATQAHAAPVKTVPQDGAGAYATGKYRNLLAEAGHTPKEIQAKIDAAYGQLFHGDAQTRPLSLPPAATPTAR